MLGNWLLCAWKISSWQIPAGKRPRLFSIKHNWFLLKHSKMLWYSLLESLLWFFDAHSTTFMETLSGYCKVLKITLKISFISILVIERDIPTLLDISHINTNTCFVFCPSFCTVNRHSCHMELSLISHLSYLVCRKTPVFSLLKHKKLVLKHHTDVT